MTTKKPDSISAYAKKGMALIKKINASKDSNEKLMLHKQLMEHIMPKARRP